MILIGDSSVGKTSFMKRVQTGRFSLDLPASVGETSVRPSVSASKSHSGWVGLPTRANLLDLAGTDSCISCVLVDGKRVALQLWDTAGQER